MTTINTNFMTQAGKFGGVPFGNTLSLEYHFETTSAGVAVGTDFATAVQSGDIVRLGILPAGFKLEDALLIISSAFAGSTTASFGFLYTDGVDVSTAPQDSAYFSASAVSTASTGVSRKTGVKAPLVLAKDAYLTLTVGGAAHSSAGVLDIVVIGVDKGAAIQ